MVRLYQIDLRMGRPLATCACLLGVLLFARQATAGPEGAFPISYCIYRIPYDLDTSAGEYVKINSSNVLQWGHNGVDMNGRPYIDWSGSGAPVGYPLVAAADGIVRRVTDGNSGCCRGCTACNNKIWIEHPSGEFSAYFHIAPNSALVSPGDPVQQGDPIASEGDVGAVCGCPDGKGACPSHNRPTAGCDGDMGTAGCGEDSCPCCAVHLHFGLYYNHDGSPYDTLTGTQFDGQRVPFVCGIGNFVIAAGGLYDGGTAGNVGPCDTGECIVDIGIPPGQVDPTAVWVAQADNSITSSDLAIEPPDFGAACDSDNPCTLPEFCSGGVCRTGGASVVFRAGDHVTLNLGFHAKRGSYFRGEIGPCNSECN